MRGFFESLNPVRNEQQQNQVLIDGHRLISASKVEPGRSFNLGMMDASIHLGSDNELVGENPGE